MDRLPSATQASLHIIHTSFHFVCVVSLGECFERHSILCIPMIPFLLTCEQMCSMILTNIWSRRRCDTDPNRTKNAASWYYSQVFREEPITPRREAPSAQLPPLLRAARSLETGMSDVFQTRESVFLKQGKLLANFEDDFQFDRTVVRYFPTYQSLTDEELRGYFTWRGMLRRGILQQTSLSFAFLYIYELINRIGVSDPMDGFRKLQAFRADYSSLDERIVPYLNRWLTDYAVYYGLDPACLADSRQVLFDRDVTVLDTIPSQSDEKICEAMRRLSGKWLDRSKFYARNREDFDTVLASVMRRIWAHYDKGCKRTMVEQYFGPLCRFQARLFENAVFCGTRQTEAREYVIDERYRYICAGGLWTVEKHACPPKPNAKLSAIVKTVDAIMREEYGFPDAVRMELDTKWLLAIIREECRSLLQKKKEAQAKKLRFDDARLATIRREATVTEAKLYIPDEEPEEPAPILPPEPEREEEAENEIRSLLSPEEYRLLHTLLYGGSLDWVRSRGLMLSVLTDSINENLYDLFGDSVLEAELPPSVIEDYKDELKEMVKP